MPVGPTEQDIAIARMIVDEYAVERPIAFPELLESLSRRVFPLSRDTDLELARRVLREYLGQGRITIHMGRALDDDLPPVDGKTAASLVEDLARYEYGDGDEIRSWLSLEP